MLSDSTNSEKITELFVSAWTSAKVLAMQFKVPTSSRGHSTETLTILGVIILTSGGGSARICWISVSMLSESFFWVSFWIGGLSVPIVVVSGSSSVGVVRICAVAGMLMAVGWAGDLLSRRVAAYDLVPEFTCALALGYEIFCS